MAPRRVILDSDDEGEAISPVKSPRSPRREHTSPEQTMHPPSNPAGTGSSTDPILFQRIYDSHHRVAMQESPQEFTNSAQLPVLDDQIINQRMSSSPANPTSVKRLKRSRTMNPSSLTSVTSPHELNPRAKRSKSVKGMDNLTQITSPGEPAPARRDDWEFPDSSAPKPEPLKLRRPGKDSATKEKKTYGKLKRSKTMMHSRSSQSEVPEREKSVSKDDSHVFGRKRRASHSQDFDVSQSAPKPKKHKQDLHGTQTSGEESVDLVETEKKCDAVIVRGSSSEAARIEVPRTASEEQATQPAKLLDLSFVDESMITSPRLKTANTEQVPTATSDDKSTSSISIVPATLSDSQKMTYENVSVASTNQERRSSIAEVAPEPEQAGQANLIPGDTPQANLEAVEVSRRMISSSPPVVAAPRKIKRAKSSSVVEANRSKSPAVVSSAEVVPSTVLPRKRRSKTLMNGRTLQSSIDELSYTKSQELEKSVASKVPAKEPRKKAVKGPVEPEDVNELFGSDEVGLPREQYQPRPSKRRSMSTGVTPVIGDKANLTSGLQPRTRKKSVKQVKDKQKVASGEASTLQSNVAPSNIETDEIALVRPSEKEDQPVSNLIDLVGSQDDETIVANTDTMTGTTEIPVIPPVAPKRRGRPPNVPVAEKTAKIADTAKEPENSTLLGEPSDQIETPVEPAKKVAPAAKRRGRPPKSTEKVVENIEEVEVLSNEETLVENVPKDAKNVLREDHYDEQSGNQASGPGWSKPADFLLPKSTPPSAETTAALPLVTPTKNIKKGPDHSPLPSGKVPYRVGLSKRSRIAPLLKMIKK